MKFYIPSITIVLLLSSILANAQNPKGDDFYVKKASDFFPKEKAQVLVVGTFHFDYPGFDANKTADEDKVDVLLEPRKSEVSALVEYIKKFKPNKIAIEAFPNWNATEKLREYKAGEHRDERDERYQLGMRLAEELQLDTLYAIDAESMDADLMKLDSNFTNALFEDFDFQSDDPYNKLVFDWFQESEKQLANMDMLSYFQLMNSRESHQYDYGAYLVGDFNLGDVQGADLLSVWWYNRNLRIFRKMQKIKEDKDDRILLIFGNGHAAILRQLLECSPEYEFVEFDSLK